MKTLMRGTYLLAALIVIFSKSTPCMADVTLPAILGSNMVLQQQKAVPIWGKADTSEKVTVAFAGQNKTAVADADGKWKVALDAMPASKEGRTLTVTGKNTVKLENIVVGEVWICSGQSNMELGLIGTKGGRVEVPKANRPLIRLFKVPHLSSPVAWDDCQGNWDLCTPETATAFSAVAYYFGKELTENLDVPVGLVAAPWGGKTIETFVPQKAMAESSWGQALAKNIDRLAKSYDIVAQKKLRDEALAKWKEETAAYQQAKEKGTATGVAPRRPGVPDKASPGGIYNGMITPLIPLAMRGVIWYQGESNRNDGMVYRDKMKSLITGWREAWGQGEFPFYFVQIAPYRWTPTRSVAEWPPIEPPSAESKPWQLTYPLIWKSQLDSLKIPNTGMAVTMDIGENTNIHPAKKLEVGQRLSLWALANTYGKKGVVVSGPIYKSMSVEGDKIRVQLDCVGGGLVSRDGKEINWFEVAGADKIFYPAQAVVKGNDLIVSSEKVKTPVSVRFAWDEIANPNLMNKEGLPASSFTSDSLN